MLELLEPDRMESGEEVEGEASESGFGWNMLDCLVEGWDCSCKICGGGRGDGSKVGSVVEGEGRKKKGHLAWERLKGLRCFLMSWMR